MNTEASEDPSTKNAEPQEAPVEAGVSEEAPVQAAEPQETPVKKAESAPRSPKSPFKAASSQNPLLRASKSQISVIHPAVLQDSELQDTEPQESEIQDAGPPKEGLLDPTSANRSLHSRVSQFRVETMHLESDSPRQMGTINSSTLLHALQVENKRRRVGEVLIRLREREENEQKIQEERELSRKISKEKRKLDATSSEERRRLSSRASGDKRKQGSVTSEERRRLSSRASVDKGRLGSMTSEDRRKSAMEDDRRKSAMEDDRRKSTMEEVEDDLKAELEDEMDRQSAKSTTSTTVQVDIEDVYVNFDLRSSYSSMFSTVTLPDADLDSEDVMRTAVNELMLVPSLSDLSLSEERPLHPSISTKSLKSLKSAKSVKSSKSSKSALSDPGSVAVSEPETSESESDGLSESRPDSPQKPDGDEGSQASVESAPQRTSDIAEIPFEEVQPRAASNDFDAFFAAHRGKHTMNLVEVQSHQKGIDIQRIVQDFITALIRSVVGATDPYQYCRSQMDKRKLLNGLLDKVKEHIELMAMNRELNEQLVEYCRRTKNTRALIELSEAESESYQCRYRAGLDYLEYGQNRVALIKAKVGRLITTAQLELCNVMHIALGTEQHLENTMRRVVIRPDSESDLLKRLVAHELRLMAEHRNQISDTRFLLITQTHNLGNLKEQIKRLETLSDSVSMNDFITVQTNVISLQKKIEERNLELKRLRSQYHTELHLTKHNREKALALKDRVVAIQEQLVEKNKMRNDLKDRLYHVKMERKQIRANTNELAFQGGILSMPSLMYDYDRTMVIIQDKQQRIAALKETMKTITQQIHALWAQMSSKSFTQL